MLLLTSAVCASTLMAGSPASARTFNELVYIYTRNPSFAKSACASMLRFNREGVSAFGYEAIVNASRRLRMNPESALAILTWLNGNYCPEAW